MGTGAVRIPPDRVAAILASWLTGDAQTLGSRDALVILNIRLPRLLLGAMVGAGLAVAGALMQGLFRNPLADPGLVGVSAGARLAAAATIVLGDRLLAGFIGKLPFASLPAGVFLGGLLTTTLLYLIATRAGRHHQQRASGRCLRRVHQAPGDTYGRSAIPVAPGASPPRRAGRLTSVRIAASVNSSSGWKKPRWARKMTSEIRASAIDQGRKPAGQSFGSKTRTMAASVIVSGARPSRTPPFRPRTASISPVSPSACTVFCTFIGVIPVVAATSLARVSAGCDSARATRIWIASKVCWFSHMSRAG
jgi:hypothetical protein